jgi:catechol 2,3-dioxygenase-like lactoylglutathione lyase family enzyme
VIVSGLDHVNVSVPEDLESEVVAWYTGVLELEPASKPEGTRRRGSWFELGNAQLHISVEEHNPPHSAHFCLIVEDFDSLIERLRARGNHLEQARPIPGRHRCFTRDPAGNRVELMTVDETEAHVIYEERG